MDKPEYLSVSLLTQYLKRKFDYDPYLQKVFLVGEISNFRLRLNSHQYFSLKDDHAKINAVMYARNFQKLKFTPEEGMKVLVVGRISLYGPSGSYQIQVDAMEPDGVGALYQAYEQLKKKLTAEGLFSLPKKEIPRFPQKIAVVTSRSGAVIRDIITTAKRRYPKAQIILFPADVQGENAKYSLVNAMKQISQNESDYDVLIIGRGGGSIEDLWPFNEEVVVRQIAALNLPVISSVGHETDTTLSDLVADVRAATPTAAAEIATPNLVDELVNIQKLRQNLYSRMAGEIRLRQTALAKITSRAIFQHPERLFDQQSQRLDQLRINLNNNIQRRLISAQNDFRLTQNKLSSQLVLREISQKRQKNEYLSYQLFDKIKTVLTKKKHDEILLIKQLDELSPLKILGRGYVYTTDTDNQVITSVKNIVPEKELKLHFIDGQVTTTVQEVTEETHDR